MPLLSSRPGGARAAPAGSRLAANLDCELDHDPSRLSSNVILLPRVPF